MHEKFLSSITKIIVVRYFYLVLYYRNLLIIFPTVFILNLNTMCDTRLTLAGKWKIAMFLCFFRVDNQNKLKSLSSRQLWWFKTTFSNPILMVSSNFKKKWWLWSDYIEIMYFKECQLGSWVQLFCIWSSSNAVFIQSGKFVI